VRILKSIIEALSVIRATRPDCVLGMGGFASGPGGIAARLSGKPLIIHEQNAVAGMTNRILARFAQCVLEAFPGSFGPAVEARLVGNPLRTEIEALYRQPRPEPAAGRPVRLLVLGGSLGAESLNTCLPEALARLDERTRPEVWHQSGEKNFDATRQRYAQSGVPAKVSPFIENMAEAYQWADFVVCRAGALTISELCMVGLGAILVPYPHAVDDHQTRNAQFMVDAGAAWLLPQSQLNPKALAEILEPLLARPERIGRLGSAARRIARPEATAHVVNLCLQEAQ
jgi:UDP-N-acetylglucosamine--N-acetylmuramyl-(pentapeptide) pyrophosphoryl-undecaprenol N-acetylglucosamine transferase